MTQLTNLVHIPALAENKILLLSILVVMVQQGILGMLLPATHCVTAIGTPAQVILAIIYVFMQTGYARVELCPMAFKLYINQLFMCLNQTQNLNKP